MSGIITILIPSTHNVQLSIYERVTTIPIRNIRGVHVVEPKDVNQVRNGCMEIFRFFLLPILLERN